MLTPGSSEKQQRRNAKGSTSTKRRLLDAKLRYAGEPLERLRCEDDSGVSVRLWSCRSDPCCIAVMAGERKNAPRSLNQ